MDAAPADKIYPFARCHRTCRRARASRHHGTPKARCGDLTMAPPRLQCYGGNTRARGPKPGGDSNLLSTRARSQRRGRADGPTGHRHTRVALQHYRNRCGAAACRAERPTRSVGPEHYVLLPCAQPTLVTPLAVHKFGCTATRPTSCFMRDTCRTSTRSHPHPESTNHNLLVETPPCPDLTRTDRAAALMKPTSYKPKGRVAPSQERPMLHTFAGPRHLANVEGVLPDRRQGRSTQELPNAGGARAVREKDRAWTLASAHSQHLHCPTRPSNNRWPRNPGVAPTTPHRAGPWPRA